MIPHLVNLNILASLANYSRMGDVATIAICAVVFILLGSSYVVREKSFRIFGAIIGFIVLAAIANVGFNAVISRNNIVVGNPWTIGVLYLLRVFYHTFLFCIFFNYALYAIVVSKMEKKRARRTAIAGTVLFAIFVGVDVALTITGVGFHINSDTGEAT